jgi:hypothetical protein
MARRELWRAETPGRQEAGLLTRIEDLEETGQRIDRELLAICRASQSCGLHQHETARLNRDSSSACRLLVTHTSLRLDERGSRVSNEIW